MSRSVSYGVLVSYHDEPSHMHGPYRTAEKARAEMGRLRGLRDRCVDADAANVMDITLIPIESGSVSLSKYREQLS